MFFPRIASGANPYAGGRGYRYTDDMTVSHESLFRRRQFLQLIALSGLVAGCRTLVRGSHSSTMSAVTRAPTLPPTLTLDIRFGLENDAVEYAPNPAGCQRISMQGRVQGGGNWVLRLWGSDPDQVSAIETDTEGGYAVDVATQLTDTTYHLQLFDPASATLVSDVIVVQAIPSCDLNLMTVNFILAR